MYFAGPYCCMNCCHCFWLSDCRPVGVFISTHSILYGPLDMASSRSATPGSTPSSFNFRPVAASLLPPLGTANRALRRCGYWAENHLTHATWSWCSRSFLGLCVCSLCFWVRFFNSSMVIGKYLLGVARWYIHRMCHYHLCRVCVGLRLFRIFSVFQIYQ